MIEGSRRATWEDPGHVVKMRIDRLNEHIKSAIMKLLERDPEHRMTMEELVRSLNQVIGGSFTSMRISR